MMRRSCAGRGLSLIKSAKKPKKDNVFRLVSGSRVAVCDGKPALRYTDFCWVQDPTDKMISPIQLFI